MNVYKDTKVELLDHPHRKQLLSTTKFAMISRYDVNKNKKITESDMKRLLTNLYNWGHYTPLRYLQVMFTVYAPIYSLEQIKRHTVGINVNQMSLRYNKEPLGVYIPFEENTTAYNIIYDSTYKSFQEYNKLLKEGIKPEEARAVLPTSTMSVMGITFNVESFRHICKARINKKAQPVTSDVILKMYNLTRNIFPFNLVEVEKWD